MKTIKTITVYFETKEELRGWVHLAKLDGCQYDSGRSMPIPMDSPEISAGKWKYVYTAEVDLDKLNKVRL